MSDILSWIETTERLQTRIAELEALVREAKECIDDEFGKCGLVDRIDAALRSTKTEGDAPQSMGD